ncbi:MAG: hypothetical protein N2110_05595 [Flavobacteriales bacterium]|nr:hypothetical protein [Flavobacteriales bacterium]
MARAWILNVQFSFRNSELRVAEGGALRCIGTESYAWGMWRAAVGRRPAGGKPKKKDYL